jgi:osmotically inducible lipoprotein OsmB
MRKHITAIACISALAVASVAGCTKEERIVAGGMIGAGAGLLTASVLGANSNWTILTVLAGAAAGALVAKNKVTGKCAYARGDGTYYEAACP